MIMKKFPFTTAGVQAANVHFYNLSDAELWDEVHAVQDNFTTWVTSTFDIQGEDLDCLLNFNDHCNFILGNQLAVTMSLRLPFRLERKPIPPDVSVMGVKRGRGYNPIGTNLTGPDAPTGEGEFVYIIEA
jgi:hypothetical protein